MADIDQYAADTGLAAESLYTDQHIVLIDRHNKKIQQDGYVHTMSTLEMEHDIPIVMFDNRRLVHGATQVQPENYESRRRLGRILLTFSPWSQNSNYGPAKYPSNSTTWHIRSMAESAFFDPW